jgi:hypothetical protein
LRNLRPQALGTPTTAITDIERNHLTAPGIHGNPDPLFVSLFLHKAGHFIRFHLQALDHHVRGARDGLDMEMIR